MWFDFTQNNSGGSFHTDDKVCHRLFIEAYNYNKAEQFAQELGVYFDGVDEGIDCGCCGDRWSRGHEVIFPLDYGDRTIFNSIEEWAQFLADKYGWTTPDARIFYKGGQMIEIYRPARDE